MPKFNKQERITIVITSIVMVTAVFLVIKFAYAYDGEPKWGLMLINKCFIENYTYFYMRVSNATECGGIVKWYDSHNWEFVTEINGQVVLLFKNDRTAEEKAFEEGIVENK